jgi:hypothetical protein
MKQTAVQWLIEQLKQTGCDVPYHLEQVALTKEAIQAKEFLEKVSADSWYIIHKIPNNYEWTVIKGVKVKKTTDELFKQYF